MLAHDEVRAQEPGEAPVRDREAPVSWPPKKGELWMAAERWPATGVEPEIPGGSWVTILNGSARFDPLSQAHWWRGAVLGPNGVAWISAAEGDLLSASDPRFAGAA